MKLTALKKYFKKAAVLSAAALTVLLASCSGLTDFDTAAQKKENQVYVRVGDVDIARAAKPVYTYDDFTGSMAYNYNVTGNLTVSVTCFSVVFVPSVSTLLLTKK